MIKSKKLPENQLSYPMVGRSISFSIMFTFSIVNTSLQFLMCDPTGPPVVAGLVHRIHRACSSWKNFHESLIKTKATLERNQMPMSLRLYQWWIRRSYLFLCSIALVHLVHLVFHFGYSVAYVYVDVYIEFLFTVFTL